MALKLKLPVLFMFLLCCILLASSLYTPRNVRLQSCGSTRITRSLLMCVCVCDQPTKASGLHGPTICPNNIPAICQTTKANRHDLRNGSFWFSTLLFANTNGHWVHMIKAKERTEWLGSQHNPHFALAQQQPITRSHPLIWLVTMLRALTANPNVRQALNCLATCVNGRPYGRERG